MHSKLHMVGMTSCSCRCKLFQIFLNCADALTWSTATSKDASEVYARLMGVPPASVLPSLQPETKSYSATRPEALCVYKQPFGM